MKAIFRKSFTRDLKKIRETSLKRRLREAIHDVERASSLKDISQLVKVSGFDGFFRIRVGDYRLGIAVEAGTVEFVRCLHRREIYRSFP